MKKIHQGFTLIELMIVVAIIAILAALAIPQYQNYVVKSQMTRAVSELSSLRTSVEICEADGRTGGECELDSVSSDMLLTTPTVNFEPSSVSASFGQNSNPRLHGGTITLTRIDPTGWECEMTVPSGVPESLMPKNCR